MLEQSFCNKTKFIIMATASNEVSRRRRISYEQLEILWQFLNSHREVATGFNKSTQARAYSRRMWMSVTKSLNSLRDGATKDWKGWSSYWVDYKGKLKRRWAAYRASQDSTGGDPEGVPLNDVEKKFLSLLGKRFGSGSPNIQLTPVKHIEPEAGLQQQAADPLSDDDNVEIIYEALLPEDELTMQEEEPTQRQGTPSEPQQPIINVEHQRRSRRPKSFNNKSTREKLINISRANLIAVQDKARSLKQINKKLQTSNEIMTGILGSLRRIATVLERSMGSESPETDVEDDLNS